MSATEYIENKILLNFDNIYKEDSKGLQNHFPDFVLIRTEHRNFKKNKRETYEVKLNSLNKDKILISYSVKTHLNHLSSTFKFLVNDYNGISLINEWHNNSSTELYSGDINNIKKVIFEIIYLEEKVIKKTLI